MTLISTRFAAEAKARKAYMAIDTIEAYDAFIRTKDFDSHVRFNDFADKFERSANEQLVVHMLESHSIHFDTLEDHAGGHRNASFGARFAIKAAHEGWVEALHALKARGVDLRGHATWDWPSYKTVDGPAQAAARAGKMDALRHLVESEGAFSLPSPFVSAEEPAWRASFPLLNSISETRSDDVARYLIDRFKCDPAEIWSDPYRLSADKLKIAHACGLDIAGLDLRKLKGRDSVIEFVESVRITQAEARPRRSTMRG